MAPTVTAPPPRQRESKRPLVAFVEQSSALGGGQLALAQYLALPSQFGRLVVLCEGGPLAKRLAAEGVDTVVLPPVRGPLAPIVNGWRLKRVIAQWRADAVVANSLRAALVIRLARLSREIPHLCHIRVGVTKASVGRLKRLVYALWVLPRFNTLLPNSEWTASTLPAPQAHQSVDVVYSVSGTGRLEHLAQQRTAEQVDAHHGPLRLLSLNRLAPWKGIDTALDAADLLRAKSPHLDFTLTIAGAAQFGEHAYEQRLRDRVTAMEGVTLVGHVDGIGDVLKDTDIVLSTSIEPEPFGQTVVQGMVAGAVVISSDQGGAAEIVRHTGGGVVVPPGDASALASAIERLALDREALTRLARAGAAAAVSTYGDSATSRLLDTAIAASIDRLTPSMAAPTPPEPR
jgi:glycosyltransferase involved in cell wall biosynthesis